MLLTWQPIGPLAAGALWRSNLLDRGRGRCGRCFPCGAAILLPAQGAEPPCRHGFKPRIEQRGVRG
jgi:hypothetical protein